MTAVALAVTGLGAAVWLGIERALRPGHVPEEHVPEEHGLAVEHVRFPSRDGLALAGWFVPGPAGAIVLLHGYGRSKAELLPQSAFLHRAGYGVLLVDFRSRGESAGNHITFGAGESLDVLGAVDYLLGRQDVDRRRIAVMGVSLGAAAGILAACRCSDIRAVIAEATFDRLCRIIGNSFRAYTGLPKVMAWPTVLAGQWRLKVRLDDLSPLRWVGHISPRPVLILHGMADELIPPAASEALYAAAGEPKELWLIPGALHSRGYQAAPQEYEARVLAFLARHLRPGG